MTWSNLSFYFFWYEFNEITASRDTNEACNQLISIFEGNPYK